MPDKIQIWKVRPKFPEYIQTYEVLVKISRCKKLAVSGKHTCYNLFCLYLWFLAEGKSTGNKHGENLAKMTSGNMVCDSICLMAYTGPEEKHFKRKRVIVRDVDTQWQADLLDVQQFSKHKIVLSTF